MRIGRAAQGPKREVAVLAPPSADGIATPKGGDLNRRSVDHDGLPREIQNRTAGPRAAGLAVPPVAGDISAKKVFPSSGQYDAAGPAGGSTIPSTHVDGADGFGPVTG